MKTFKHLATLVAALALLSPQLGRADGTQFPEDPGLPMSSWGFLNTNTWVSDTDYAPLGFTNISGVNLGDGTALLIDSTNPAYLNYKTTEADGTTNLTVDSGSLLLWAAPASWSGTNQGGTGPEGWGRLLEVGALDSTNGWWSLYLDPAGCYLYFSAQDGQGHETNYLSAPIAWSTNQWINIALTYSPTNSALYLSGVLATNGGGLSILPSVATLTNGFFIGSDSSGGSQARVMLDDLSSYSFPLDANEVANIYNAFFPNYYLNPNNAAGPDEFIDPAPSYTTNAPVFRAIMGTGYVQYLGAATNWAASSNVWMSGVTANLGSNGLTTISFSVQGGSSNVLYDVFGAAGLSGNITNTDWSWLGQVSAAGRFCIAGLPNAAVFIILGTPYDQDGDGLTDAFERLSSHSDPKNAQSLCPGIPDWWIWIYFGNASVSATNFDGHPLLYYYTNGINPNIVSFTFSATNNYVNQSSVPVQISLLTGIPSYYAVLVDDTNLADADWLLYRGTNITVNLGATQGWHEVQVGLRAHADAPSAGVWQWSRFKLDTTAPALFLTGPTNSTVTAPMIQLTGYSPEALASLTYDLSNATGVVMGQLAVITGQAYSTNTAEFTTNYFQCYDVPLTNGLNAITLHATDLSGNMAAFTTNIVCLGNTNSPAVSLLWPQNGLQMSGGSFTIKGQVDDPTSTVSVSTVDTNGNTTVINGLVGRDGIFWVENVPLSAGTNSLTLSLINAVGTTNTSFSLIQSSVGLSIKAVQPGDTTASGGMDTDGYMIWVNGASATNNGDHTWTAQIAPIGIGGGLVLVTAIPNTETNTWSGGGVNPTSAHSINTQATVQPAQGIFVSSYHVNDQTTYNLWQYDANLNIVWYTENWYNLMNWQDGQGGSAESFLYEDSLTWFPALFHTDWSANAWPQPWPNGTETDTYWNYDPDYQHPPSQTFTNTVGAPSLPMEYCDTRQVIDADGSTERRTADTELKLATGGPLGSTEKNFWTISATATVYADEADNVGSPVPPEQICIGGFGHLDTNGSLVIVLPDNDPDVVTPSFSCGRGRGSAIVIGVKNTLVSLCEATGLPSTNRYTVGVGERVDLSFNPEPSSPVKWTVPIVGLSGTLSSTSGRTTTFTAPSRGGTTSVTVSSGRGTNSVAFTVLEPTNFVSTYIVATNNLENFGVVNPPHFSVGQAGAQMLLRVVMGPTNVSFYRVQMHEVPLDATNLTGYFTNTALFSSNPAHFLYHATARADWFTLGADNSWEDTCWIDSDWLQQPWSSGSFTWNVPWGWGVDNGSGDYDHPMTNGWQQVFSVDTNGTARITKFIRSWVQRTTNSVVTVPNIP